MATIAVTYKLTNPKSRPNPFRLGNNIVFKDGACTLLIEDGNLGQVDKQMRSYGAVRETGKDNGQGSDAADRKISNGKASSKSDADQGSEDNSGAGDDGDKADPADEGSEGSEADAGDSQGSSSEEPALEPVARLKKAEKEAGLDNLQAAYFRASGEKDAAAWLEAVGKSVAAAGQVDDQDEDDII